LTLENADGNLDGLFFTVLGSGDYEKSDKVVFEFSQRAEDNLRINAVLCIGHIARIYKKLDLEKYLPILEDIIRDQNQNPGLIARAEDALNDIWIFCEKRKNIRDYTSETCISRYFQTLSISHHSEKEERYEDGIKRIKELREKEVNPSVKQAQDSSIEFLSHSRI
jgi:flavodoxin